MNRILFLIISLIINVILIFYLFNIHTFMEDKNKVKDAQEPMETPTNIEIVMLGNSITHAGEWQKVLNRDDVLNGGKPGWTTQQLSWVIKDFVIPNNPKLCFFKGGINDYTLGISTQRIYDNICINLDSIRKVGTNPVYTTTLYQKGNTYRNRQIDSLNAKMKEFCKEKGYDFVDLRPFLCKNGDILDQYVKDDNTHLRPEAYPQWAKAIQPTIKKYGL